MKTSLGFPGLPTLAISRQSGNYLEALKEVMEVEDRLGANDWEEPKKEKISNVEAIRYMLENMK